MKEKGIKNLIFDFGNVLTDLDKNRCVSNFKALGLQHVDSLISDSSKQGFFKDQEKGLITSDQFRDYVRQLIGKPVSNEQIDAAWNSFLVEIPSYRLAMLLELRKKYKVYLLSNTNAIHWKWACKNLFAYKGFTINSYFEKLYLSYEMKMLKPDIEIFQAVLDDADIDPHETFFVDDSAENCRAAQSLGLSTYMPKPGEDWSGLFLED
jgi:putative hydrolase of the HAD superfamily